nr:unnamed protein product [Spirometra erinaceieuropaei]
MVTFTASAALTPPPSPPELSVKETEGLENVEKDWRLKYDSIVDELEECKAARRQTENRLAIYENEVVQRENCHKAELMQLMQKLQNAEVKICMLEAESREASKSAFIRVADLDLTDATPLNLASKSLKPEKESEAVLPRSETGWGGDNEIAEKENSAEPQISRPPSSLRTPSPLTTSGRHTLSIDEALRPESPNMDEVTRLKRRLVVARHLVEELNNRNGSLSQELLSVQSLYKMDVQTLREKITVLTENLESERNAHLLRSGELNRQIQSLHGRIGELLKDRESIMSENANLSAKVNSLKELTQRLRRQHATELDQMNQLVQDRDGTIYELSAFLSSNPVYLDDGAPASVQPDDVQSEPLEVHTKSGEASRPITRRIHTTDASQSVIVDLEPPNQPAPPNETLPLGEVTQYCHSETSSVFNEESRREQTAFIDIAESREPEAQPEVTRLQRELTRVKSNLIAQVKTNTRLRAAYNALALSLPIAERSVGRSTALALSEADKGISPFLRMSKLTPRERSQASLSRSYTFGDGVAYENQPDPLEETSAHLHAALDQLKLDLSQPGGDVPAAAAAATTPGIADGQPAADFAHRSRVLSPIAESEAPEGANPPVRPTADGPEDLTQPGSLRKLRDLYSVIRNLLLHLDDVRAVQRSFVETINRSCAANVSLNETGLAASLVQHYSFTCDPVQKQDAGEKEAAEAEQPLPTAAAAAGEVEVDEVSRRSPSTRTPTAAVGSEHLDLADDTEQVCSVAQERDETEVSQRHNVSFFNGTIAELRHNYPASPEVSVSLGAEGEDEEGRDAQPSATATVSSSSVLNKTFPLTQPQPPPQQLMATLRQSAALANSMTNVSYSFEQSSGFGNVTFVELTNRKVFDRLSQAMVKLRNAIEECSVVVSDDLLHLAPSTAAAAPPTGLFGVSPAFHGAPADDQRPISLASDSTITQTAGDAGKSLLTNTEAIFNYDDVSDVSSATLDSPRCSHTGQAGDVQPPGPHSEAEGGKESQAISLDPQLSEMAHSLLTRFVHVMARVQTVATSMGAAVRSTGDVNNSGAAQPVSKGDIASDPAASPGRGHPDSPRQITAAFEAWSERARDWFSAFNAALRDPTFLPFIEGKLTALEEDFLQMFAELEQARQAREAKATQCVCRLKATHKCIIDLLASSGKTSEEQFQAYLSLQTKCEVLSSELGASVPVSEHHALQTEYSRVRSAYEKLRAQHRCRQPSLDRPSEELEEAICNSVSELDATMPSSEHPNRQIEHSRLNAAQDDLETRPEDSVPRADHEELLKRYRQLTADYGSLSDKLREAKHDYEERLRTTVPTQEHEALRSEFSRLSATYEELAALVESTVSRTVYEKLAEEHRHLQEVQESVSKELKLVREELASKIAASVPLTEHEALQSKCSKLQADCQRLLTQLDSTVPNTEHEVLRDEHRRLESEYRDLSQELEHVSYVVLSLAADPSPPEDVPAVELPRASSAVCASPFTLPPVPPVAVTGTASPTFCIAEGREGTATSRSSPLLGIHSDLAPRMALAVNKSSPQPGCCTCFHLSSPPASATLGVIQYAQGPRAVTSSSRQSSTRFPTPPPLPPTCTESADSSRTNLVEVSSLMSDLLSVSQDFSKRLRAMQQTVSQLQSPPQTDAVSLPESLSSTSSITCPSPDKGQTADMQVVSVLKEDIARCASQLSHLCSNLVARLMPMHLDSPSVNPTVGEIQFSGCTSEAHRKARGLIRRVVRHLSASCHPDSSESYVADALADLRVVLSLLKTRPTSAPERLEVNTCQPQQQQHSLPQSSLDPRPPLGRHSHLRREDMAGNLRDISAMLTETDHRLAASCSSLREFVAIASDRHGRRSAEPY